MFKIYTVTDENGHPVSNGDTDQDSVSRLCHDMNIESIKHGKTPCYFIGTVDADGRIMETIPDALLRNREYAVTDGDDTNVYIGGGQFAYREAHRCMTEYNNSYEAYAADDDDGPKRPYYMVQYEYPSGRTRRIDE